MVDPLVGFVAYIVAQVQVGFSRGNADVWAMEVVEALHFPG
jgi:hypothetical protein